MPKIPLYLKTERDMPRPPDSEYYLLAKNGLFLCRNHRFFRSDVRTARAPKWLVEHESGCRLDLPQVERHTLERIVGFFGRVFELHGSEAIVLLLWNQQKRRYRILVPEQEATVVESASGLRSALDVSYKIPLSLPPGELLVGDLHCHAGGDAYSSPTDREDEYYRDGFHGVVGRIQREPPRFHLEFIVDGVRFGMDFKGLFKGYQKRWKKVPQRWLKRVKVKVVRSHTTINHGYVMSGVGNGRKYS
jgi:hypothetical protein